MRSANLDPDLEFLDLKFLNSRCETRGVKLKQQCEQIGRLQRVSTLLSYAYYIARLTILMPNPDCIYYCQLFSLTNQLN